MLVQCDRLKFRYQRHLASGIVCVGASDGTSQPRVTNSRRLSSHTRVAHKYFNFRAWISRVALTSILVGVAAWSAPAFVAAAQSDRSVQYSYPIVDTGQVRCYNDRHEIHYPARGEPFFGQDAQYRGLQPSYRDNGDGTVSDLTTGLMWQQDPGSKMSWRQAMAGASRCRLGGHHDWRLPTVKELYSLILFSGTDPDPGTTSDRGQRPFIDTDYFRFAYGDPSKGERLIDAQFATSTKYVSTTMVGDATMFGVNFADGRIKGYPIIDPRSRRDKTFFVLYVRGNPAYGANDFHDNGDGTITDRATGLTWAQLDSGHLRAGEKRDGRLNWQQALEWVEELKYAGHDDWRLPNAKELQSIVDYSRSPDTTRSPAIAPIFKVSTITRGDGRRGFPCYWSGTTHATTGQATAAAYVAFGESLGWMQDPRTRGYRLLDVHGAGSQRSDPKSGDPSRYPRGRGPQGDVIYIDNFVRPVRGGQAALVQQGPALEMPVARIPSGPRTQSRQPAQPRGDRRGHFTRRFDRDGDGRVSPAEFPGPGHHFQRFDRNRDGYLSDAEAPPPPPQRRPQPR